MSTLKVDNIRHNSATSDTITMASDGTCTARITSVGGGQLSHRNKIYNGAMMISQRGTTFDVNTSSDYTLDRFQVVDSGGITYDATVTQDSSAPEGFRKSLKISPDTVETSMSGSENAMIQQKLEGQDCQDFAFGTSSAKKLTISFYAKSGSQNNNHQYTLQIRKYDDSGNRNMVNRAFTVTTSWQRYIMTFDGDTAENIRNDNGLGIQLIWHLATGPSDIHEASTTFGRTVNNSLYSGVTGQSNFLDNTNNEFYLTGVQLEVGDTATSFEHRSHGDELRRCQRYYEEQYFMDDAGGSYIRGPVYWKVEKRAAGSPRVHAKRPDGTGSDTVDKIYQASGERDAQCFYSWTGGTMVFNTGSFNSNQDTLGRVSIDIEL